MNGEKVELELQKLISDDQIWKVCELMVVTMRHWDI